MRLGATTKIPPLSERPLLRYLSLGALYVAQGIPEGFLIYAMPAWLAMNGRSPGEIGAFLGVSLLPWSFKLVNAPIMDRFTFLPMGRRRPWVLVGQLGLIVTFLLRFVRLERHQPELGRLERENGHTPEIVQGEPEIEPAL
jgi:Na+/melibiose symporter-like transporter